MANKKWVKFLAAKWSARSETFLQNLQRLFDIGAIKSQNGGLARSYRRQHVVLVQSQVVVGEELLDAVQVALQLAALQHRRAADHADVVTLAAVARRVCAIVVVVVATAVVIVIVVVVVGTGVVVVRDQVSCLLAEVPLVLCEPLNLKQQR